MSARLLRSMLIVSTIAMWATVGFQVAAVAR